MTRIYKKVDLMERTSKNQKEDNNVQKGQSNIDNYDFLWNLKEQQESTNDPLKLSLGSSMQVEWSHQIMYKNETNVNSQASKS